MLYVCMYGLSSVASTGTIRARRGADGAQKVAVGAAHVVAYFDRTRVKQVRQALWSAWQQHTREEAGVEDAVRDGSAL